MSATQDLDGAIQLIRQGQYEQARLILQALIRTNQQDLVAWSWYVRSWPTTEDRIKALELCLKYNPGNVQLQQAIDSLRGKQAAPPSAISSPVVLSNKPEYLPEQSLPSYQSSSPAISSTYTNPTNEEIDHQVLMDMRKDQEEKEHSGRPFKWYEVWLTALTKPNVNAYNDLLRDPEAKPGRVYMWIFMATMCTGLLSLLNPTLTEMITQIEQKEGAENLGMIISIILIVMIPVSAGFSVLGLIFGAAIYNMIAKLFSGSGNFSRTVYAIGAYTAPFTIITAALSIIPYLNCLSIPLSFYSIWLGVTAIRASQRLGGGSAFMVVLMPTLLVFMLACLIFLIAGQSLLQAIPNQPTY